MKIEKIKLKNNDVFFNKLEFVDKFCVFTSEKYLSIGNYGNLYFEEKNIKDNYVFFNYSGIDFSGIFRIKYKTIYKIKGIKYENRKN